MKHISKFSLFLLFLLGLVSCEDFLEQESADQLTNQNVISNVDDLRGTTFGVYDQIQNSLNQQHLFSGNFIADDTDAAAFLQGGFDVFTKNQLTVQTPNSSWLFLYKAIHDVTFILEELEKMENIETAQKEAFKGELKALRAYSYITLARNFGNLPLVNTTDATINKTLARTDVSEIYTAFVLPELLEAEQLIPEAYATEAETKTRVTKVAAQALLANLYLLIEDWDNAEVFATKIIDNPNYALEANFADLFSTPEFSAESIWEIYFDTEDRSFFGRNLQLFGVPTTKIVNAFETGDLRYDASIQELTPGFFQISKFKKIATGEDRPYVFRLADMYLFRAEARAHNGNLLGAIQDINTIRNRAGLEDITPAGMDNVLLRVEQERYVEFCFEGKRWFDLLRTKRIDAVMGAFNPTTWDPEIDKLWPIPLQDLDNNPNLTQNFGY